MAKPEPVMRAPAAPGLNPAAPQPPAPLPTQAAPQPAVQTRLALDPTDRIAAMNYIFRHEARGEVVTGLLFVDPTAGDLHDHIRTVEAPLNTLGARELCPGAATLDKINAALR